jgi:F-type H+-transporting ATPase subunit epsilon
MAKTCELNIVSAHGELFHGPVASLTVTGERGDLGIFPGHTALITPIKPGQVTATNAKGEEQVFYISGGMLEVQPTVVTVLADTALRAQDIDEAAAERAKEKAQAFLDQKHSELDYAKARAELSQSLAQLRAIQAFRGKIK